MLQTLRYKQFHQSVGIGVLCLGLLVGISLTQIYTARYTATVYLVILAVVSIGLLFRIRLYTFIPIFIVSAVLGYLHGSNVDNSLRHLEQLSGKTVTMTGTIDEDPQITARNDARLVLTNILVGQKYYAGSVWVTTKNNTLKRGDTITIRDQMKPGFGTYQLSATYVSILHHAETQDPLIIFRDNFAAALRRVIVEPAASLGIGFVIGQKSALPPELEDQLRAVGLTHLVVASGYNLTILMRFSKRLFETHSKFLVIGVSSGLVITFIAISGASPSMVRAGLVAGLSLLAWSFGRRFHPVFLILYVAAITAIINPLYLWVDIGWWLSFLAFAGVLIISPLFLHAVFKATKPSAVLQLVSETLAAQLITLPLIVMVFGNLPVLAFLANILTAPLIPLAMISTVLAATASAVVPWIAQVLALPAEIVLSYVIAVVRYLSEPTWAQLDFSISSPVFIMAMFGLIITTIIFWRKTHHNFRTQSIID